MSVPPDKGDWPPNNVMVSLSDPSFFKHLEPISSWRALDSGFLAACGEHELEVTVAGSGCFRIEVRRVADLPIDSIAVTGKIPSDIAGTELHLEASANTITLGTTRAALMVTLNPLTLEIRRSDGSPVLRSGSLGMFSGLNDEWILSRARKSEDLVLGLGEKTGPLNRNGNRYEMWNTDILSPSVTGAFGRPESDHNARNDPFSTEFDPYYISIPFYQSVDEEGRASGFFVDNVYPARFEFDHEGETRIHFKGGRYVEYLFVGPGIPEILRDYTALTGRMSRPPLWAIGFHHCRWHPYTQKDVLDIAAAYRANGIPCDSIWLDIDHMDGYRVFTWNRQSYPDPAGMICKLEANGIRVVGIVDPGVKIDPGWSVYESGLEQDVFCRTEAGNVYAGEVWPGKTAFPDFATAKARKWWGELNARHIATGFAGIWNDMNEPATGAIAPDAMRFDHGRLSHNSLHNAYALLMAQSTIEGLTAAEPDRRPFVLSRAGSAGIQRYAANWLGDNMSRWSHLAISLPMTLGLGLSGQPFVGADIGGFGENCSAELLARWFQAAALSPFCRLHNAMGNSDQDPWTFGPTIEAICKASVELRYQLLPYLYSAFVESSLTGMPVMRPLVMEWPNNLEIRDLSHQYLLGPDLLVTPITEPGQTSCSVTLPPGEWGEWSTDTVYSGGTVQLAAPLDQIPLFARAGSVIPLWPDIPSSTSGYQPNIIELHLFVPTQDGDWTSSLVEDDGESLAYQRGEALITTLAVRRRGGTLRVSAVPQGRLPGHRRAGFRLVLRQGGNREEVELPSAFTWETQLWSGVESKAVLT